MDGEDVIETVDRESFEQDDSMQSDPASVDVSSIHKAEIAISVGEAEQRGSYLTKYLAYPVTVSGNEV